jgi:phospho-acceptor domain-containing protein
MRWAERVLLGPGVTGLHALCPRIVTIRHEPVPARASILISPLAKPRTEPTNQAEQVAGAEAPASSPSPGSSPPRRVNAAPRPLPRRANGAKKDMGDTCKKGIWQLGRLDNRLGRELAHEVQNLWMLASTPADPATGRPWASVRELFNAQLGRTAPDRNETMLTFVNGEPFLRSAEEPPARIDTDPRLTALWGSLEVLGDDPAERRETVAIVTDELDRMTRMVDDLLVLARAEQPDFLHLELVDVEALTGDRHLEHGRAVPAQQRVAGLRRDRRPGVLRGGTDGVSTFRDTFAYDPGSDSWSGQGDLPDMRIDLWASAAGAANGMLVLSGGVTNQFNTVTNQTLQFDPSQNAWSDLPNAQFPRYRAGGACGFFKVGGSSGGFTPTTNSERLSELDQCAVTDVPWLDEAPTTATLQPGESVTVAMNLSATTDKGVTQPGTLTAQLGVQNNTPYQVNPIDITLTVNPAEGLGEGRRHRDRDRLQGQHRAAAWGPDPGQRQDLHLLLVDRHRWRLRLLGADREQPVHGDRQQGRLGLADDHSQLEGEQDGDSQLQPPSTWLLAAGSAQIEGPPRPLGAGPRPASRAPSPQLGRPGRLSRPRRVARGWVAAGSW